MMKNKKANIFGIIIAIVLHAITNIINRIIASKKEELA